MSESYVQKSRKSHFESFANKIFTGIKEINPEYAEKRAIWELFQNALDLIDDEGKLSIERTNDGFKFSHNGKPFNDDNLGALVKQYSNGKTYGSNGEQVGQYGTGFLSTHVYGKKILLSGSVQGGDGRFRALNEFIIDRTALTPELLTLALMNQDDTVASLCDGNNEIINNPTTKTCFHYISQDSDIDAITNMLSYVKTLLPYIFCFNERLSLVTINDGIEERRYEKIFNNNGTLIIKADEIPDNNITIDFLEIKSEKIKVVYPQPSHDFSCIPKQFLFYPLMETVDIGINFLIHAQEFKPNRERDYLYKKDINEEVKKDVALNKILLTKAYDLIIEKIKIDESLNFLDITNILFVANEADFEKNLKAKYINAVKCLRRVKVGDDILDITKVSFFDKELLTKDETFTRHLFNVLSNFCILPSYETFIYLSKVVNNWIDGSIDCLKVNSLNEVCKIISESSNGAYDSIQAKQSFISVLKIISTDIELLNEIPLIPNIHHQLKSFDRLRRWDVVEESLINIFDNLCASETERYLHPDFYFISTITQYSRENFKDDFAKFCNNELNSFINGYDKDLSYLFVKVDMLTFWLANFIGLNRSSELNKQLFTFFSVALKLDVVQGEISSPTVGTNYQPAFKLLSRIYIKSIKDRGAKCIEYNTGKLLELISYLNSNPNLKDELLDKLPCFPNQSYQLKSQAEIKIDKVLDEDFKNEYFKITGKQIRDEMVLSDFEKYLQHKNIISGSELGDEIEIKLSPNRVFLPTHQEEVDEQLKDDYAILLKTLLELIQYISQPNSQWGNWLRGINQVKEEILMHRFKDKNTRLSLFSILSEDEDKINLLGRLAKIKNLQALIDAGEEKQKEENRKNNHLNYINYIGLLIQNLIETQLGFELAKTVSIIKSEEDVELTTKEEQNGQDFIIYRDKEPIYYLEVKSKWDDNGRFALSKNQTEKCASKKDNYAVISVNVDRYKKKHFVEKENISFDDLKEFVRVNDNLGDYFEKLVSENINKSEIADPKLIEYRGSIPQKLIDEAGRKFDPFVEELIDIIKHANALTN